MTHYAKISPWNGTVILNAPIPQTEMDTQITIDNYIKSLMAP